MKKNNQEQSDNEIRLDKWLWAARFYKTRSIAKAMIEGGKVHYNGQRAKVSKAVEIGATLKLRSGCGIERAFALRANAIASRCFTLFSVS